MERRNVGDFDFEPKEGLIRFSCQFYILIQFSCPKLSKYPIALFYITILIYSRFNLCRAFGRRYLNLSPGEIDRSMSSNKEVLSDQGHVVLLIENQNARVGLMVSRCNDPN